MVGAGRRDPRCDVMYDAAWLLGGVALLGELLLSAMLVAKPAHAARSSTTQRFRCTPRNCFESENPKTVKGLFLFCHKEGMYAIHTAAVMAAGGDGSAAYMASWGDDTCMFSKRKVAAAYLTLALPAFDPEFGLSVPGILSSRQQAQQPSSAALCWPPPASRHSAAALHTLGHSAAHTSSPAPLSAPPPP